MASSARSSSSAHGNGSGAASRNGDGGKTKPSPGTRVALKRATHRSTKGKGGGILPLIALMVVFALVAVVATTVVAVASAAGALMTSLEEGLPDVQQFEQLQFEQPTVVWDRDEKHALAKFQEEERQVVRFTQIPKVVLDATTSVEDRTFWENQGYDLTAIFSSIAGVLGGGGGRGGASTITQQFVRARLLPKELLAPGSDVYLRKAKEIIQAARLTQAFPGEEGKKRIITAYLNQIFYGHNAYGVAAASKAYFGKKLAALSPAEAALLAALPQSPSTLDPYRYARLIKSGPHKGDYQVPTCGASRKPDCFDVAPIIRRNYVLGVMADGFGRWTKLSREQLTAALDEPVILTGDSPLFYKAPHFVWAMKQKLDQILADSEPAESGGYKVVTTIDYGAQVIAEKYIKAAAIYPHLSYSSYLRAIRLNQLRGASSWMSILRGKGLYNGALVALDYRTGDIIAYVGSADYYGRNTKTMDPKYDVAGIGYRQPGSAWKPVVYATAFDDRDMTPGTVLMDVTTAFSRGWIPDDADHLERGPVLARKALQYSLNIPAIRTMERVGPAAVAQRTAKAGMTFLLGRKAIELAGLAAAIGTVEVRVLDLVAAYGAFGNNGFVTEPRYILKIYGPQGLDGKRQLIYDAGKPVKRAVWSPAAAWLIADILRGNTDPHQNIIWGPKFKLTNGPGGSYRTAAVKTGTTNDIRDLSTYGFLPRTENPHEHSLALGVWMGNSDHRPATIHDVQIFAADGPGRVWWSFMHDYTRNWSTPTFQRPSTGLVEKTIDAYTGGLPGPWTKSTVQEWFLTGTEPGSKGAIDKKGLIYVNACGTWFIDPVKGENPHAPASWKQADRDWAARASRGPYVYGRWHTGTAYFFGRSSWGGPVLSGPCTAPTPSPTPALDASGNPIVTPKPHKSHKPKATPTATPRPHKTPRGRRSPPAVALAAPQADVPGGLAAIGTASLSARASAAFSVTFLAKDAPLPGQHSPWRFTDLLPPAVVPDPVATAPIRLARRRRLRRGSR